MTEGPGLIGALLVGLATAKSLAFARRLPLIPVDHLHGHVASLYLEPEPLDPPFLVLLASGGHTLLAEVDDRGPGMHVVGQTLDDAAGEAFDKGARLLGLGYPGGAALERLARDGDDHAHEFAVAMAGREGLDMSFSGLKTALRTAVLAAPARTTPGAPTWPRPTSARSCARWCRARCRRSEATGRDTLAVVGGVAANGVLRGALEQACAAPACGWRWRRSRSARTTPP